MTNQLKIALAQINTHMGDLAKNLAEHIAAAELARDQQDADIIVFPELSLTGYPPEDLLLRHAFITAVENALTTLKESVDGIHILVGHPFVENNQLMNGCSLIYNGEIIETYAKLHLPNYGVFDECRYFTPRNKSCVVDIKGIPVGIVICEDAWDTGPVESAVAAGARIILDPNASPFTPEKHEIRNTVISKRARDNNVAVVYVNHVCGQDDLVFDGGSMVFDNHGVIKHFSGFFNPSVQTISIDINDKNLVIHSNADNPLMPSIERIYQALVIGVRDYINKNKFPGVLIGLSGGIDSCLTCAIAVDALGADKVHGVLLPSRYTSDMSNEDAILLSKNLKVDTSTITIEPIYQQFINQLKDEFNNKQPDTTEENLQARCRCVILMALSNACGKLVLTTSNRSEMAVGYSTLYGDMGGGFAVLKDVPKTLVYELAKYRNSIRSDIPERAITRAPSAELAPNQTDQDSLPPYEILDKILELYLNEGASTHEIIAKGYAEDLVTKIARLIRINEYKRKQAAIGPRINKKSFIRDWRYPVTNGFKG